MYEIIKNPTIDWLGIKKHFILTSLVLLLGGAVSVYTRGFNLGIDFAGGTLAVFPRPLEFPLAIRPARAHGR